MKAYITKWALTEGILEVEGKQSEHSPSLFVGSQKGSAHAVYAHGEGKHWHRTREEAIVRAEELKRRKILSLKKTIEKLEKTTF